MAIPVSLLFAIKDEGMRNTFDVILLVYGVVGMRASGLRRNDFGSLARAANRGIASLDTEFWNRSRRINEGSNAKRAL